MRSEEKHKTHDRSMNDVWSNAKMKKWIHSMLFERMNRNGLETGQDTRRNGLKVVLAEYHDDCQDGRSQGDVGKL
jgi:hypothetical protein